jgi:hypothetical protein
VDLDAGDEARELGDEPRDERDARFIERVGDTVQENCVEARVTEEDLDDTPGGRVFPKDGLDLLSNRTKHSLTPLSDVQDRIWMLLWR